MPSVIKIGLPFLCNAFFAPLGYFIIGAWRTGLTVCGLAIAAALIGFYVTVAYPPGIYAFGRAARIGSQIAVMILFGVHAAWLARRASSRGSLVTRVGGGLVVAAALACIGLAARAYWPVSIYIVASASMQPSLHEGDVVAVQGARAACGAVRPRPGEVAVYIGPGTTNRYMHRVVAGPGESVMMNARSLVLNGRAVPQRLVGHALGDGPDGEQGQATLVREQLANGFTYTVQHLGDSSYQSGRPLTLSRDQWFLMGDNRENVLDSRFAGPIAQGSVCGVAYKVLWSADPTRVGTKP